MRALFRDRRNDPYWEERLENEIYFYTIRDMLEIAFYDKKNKTFYVNTDYLKDKYIKSIISKIKKKYADSIENESEYINMKGLGI